jgi:hypothetical protein
MRFSGASYVMPYTLVKRLFAVTSILVFLYACKKNPDISPIDCSGPAKSFATDVHPIIQASCAINSGCHATGSNNGPGPLLNYSQVFNARSDIRSNVASGNMPLNGSLTATERNAILCWIDNGAVNN